MNRKLRTGKSVEKLKPLCTAGRNIKQHSHHGKQFSGSSKKVKVAVMQASTVSSRENDFLKKYLYIYTVIYIASFKCSLAL